MGIIKAIFLLIRAFLICRLSLAAEILALRQQVAVYSTPSIAPSCGPATGSFGSGSPGSGLTGDPPWLSSNPRRLSGGIDKDSSSTGDGSREPENLAGRPSNVKSAT